MQRSWLTRQLLIRGLSGAAAKYKQYVLELDQYFDAVTVSGEVGRHKPDAKVFEAAATPLGSPAETIMHVGDSAAEDFEGARKAGMRAVLLRRGQTISGDAIPSLDLLYKTF